LGEYNTMQSASKIHFKGFAELIEQLVERQGEQANELQPILSYFKEMIPLMQRLEECDATSEKIPEILEKLHLYQGELSKAFEDFCKARGVSKEELLQYYENPQNFIQKDWEEVQRAKRIVDEKAVDHT
jgi:hypothetical protein